MAATEEAWEFPVEDGLVVVRPSLPTLFYLNSSAAVIWRAYRDSGSADHAAGALVDLFGIGRETAAEDVSETLRTWRENGLIGQRRTADLPVWDGRHGAATVVSYCEIEGTKFRVLSDSAAVIAEVTPRLAGIRIDAGEPDVTLAIWQSDASQFAVVVEQQCIAVECSVGEARAVLFQEMVRRARPGREWLALLHAGACGIEGSCVLFPAASYSGKSTLAVALVANGFTLYSDDFVGLESDDLRIPVMPFAVGVRRGSWDVLQPWLPGIAELPMVERFGESVRLLPVAEIPGTPKGNASAIVFSRWVEGAEISVEPLSVAEVIARLNQSGFWVAHNRDSMQTFLGWLAQIPKYTLRYGDLRQAVEQIKMIVQSGTGYLAR